MCEGASKQTPDPKNSTAQGPRAPVWKFLDPPLVKAACYNSNTFVQHTRIYSYHALQFCGFTYCCLPVE